MNKPKIIALYSPCMGSGKSTVSEYLYWEYSYAKQAFATPLKKMVETLLSNIMWPDDTLKHTRGDLKETPIEALNGVTARHLMQTLGTEWGRNSVYPNLWVDIIKDKVKGCKATGVSAVIDDMRFPNEYEMLKEMGAEFWLIKRGDATITKQHASEGQLDKHHFDVIIENDGSIQELYSKIDKHLKGKDNNGIEDTKKQDDDEEV